MFLYFILCFNEINQEIELKKDSLSDFGSSFFENTGNSSLMISNFSPIPADGYEVPAGMTFISDSNISKQFFFPFEAFLHFSGKYYRFAPRVRFNCNLIQQFFNEKVDIKCNDSIMYANISQVNNNITLNYKLVIEDNDENHKKRMKLPLVYRTFSGNLTGVSRTVIVSDSNDINLTIFQQMPDFCKINSNSLKTNCKMVKIIDDEQKYFLAKGSNCSFWYEYRCMFLHWSSFPPNPERGFVLGPLMIKDGNNNIFYGNTANLILPTPDFTMVYNTSIITGLLLSLSFTCIIKLAIKGEKDD